MTKPPRLLVPSILACALVLALAFAATATAEVRTGDGTSPINESIAPDLDLVHASAAYDSSTGSVTLTATTRSAPTGGPGVLQAALFTATNGVCALPGPGSDPFPAMPFSAPYGESEAEWILLPGGGGPIEPAEVGTASKSVEGATTILRVTAPQVAELPFGCAEVGTSEKFSAPTEQIVFPIAVAAPPSTPVITATAPPPTPPAAVGVTAPAALSFGKSAPAKGKAGTWTKVKVTVSNTGGTAVGPIAIKAKAPKGIAVKPGSLKLPALLAGQRRTIVLQVKLTAKAKPKSTIALTGTGGGLTAVGSVVVKLAG
jgi:hypothetical protein